MLDPKLIKENPEKIQSMLDARNVDFDLEEYIQSDKKRRELIIKTDELRKKKKGRRRCLRNFKRDENSFL